MEDILVGLLSVLSTVLVVGLAVLMKKGIVDKKSLDESKELIRDTAQFTRDELEKLFESSQLVKDFIKQNYHEGQEFVDELMQFVDSLKKKGIVIKEIPKDKSEEVEIAVQEELAKTDSHKQLEISDLTSEDREDLFK